jgi:hypothetical protein
MKNGEARGGTVEGRSVLVNLRKAEWGLTRRPGHWHAVRPRRKRAIEGILYTLTELLLLRELVPPYIPSASNSP